MIRVITIEREFGAGGTAIAEKLAERLGWKLWDQALTTETEEWQRQILAISRILEA